MEQIKSQLVTLCQQSCTGTLFGVTEQNESLVITLKDGAIIGLSLSNVVGAAALSLVQTASCHKARFTNKLVMRVDADLPKTAEILEKLGANLPFETPSTKPLSPNNIRSINGEKIRTIVEKTAKKLFGPIAVLLIEEHFATNEPLTHQELRRKLQAMAEAAEAPHLAEPFILEVIENPLFSKLQ